MVSVIVDYKLDPVARYRIQKALNDFEFKKAVENWAESKVEQYSGSPYEIEYQFNKDFIAFASTFISGGVLGLSKAKKGANFVEGFVEGVKKRGDDLADAGSEIFESARQFVRNNYSQDFLNQITLKYGKENTGALAVLVKRFGDEGADLLRQGKELDEIASALVKDRVLYRHIGSEAGYLKELKKTGEIPAGYTTYFSADKFDDPIEAISKMQLNDEWTDAVWVAEFDGAQLVGKVEIPNAKWNEANYLEVLTRSFPKWGDGGASQFITKSDIKISKLRNLNTGEVIDF
ncbi:MAG: Uncharacterised protein [Formosa sp. Hel1_33_131]|nr:MAG: Uncharacterised protein [Formosa sp. Hel1_33_131]